MADRMGRWDCGSCEKIGIIGTDRFCPNCGAPTTGKWYLPEGEPAIADPELLKIAKAGPNWDCEHCSSDNRGNVGFCTQCGAAKGSSPERTVIEYGLGEAPQSGDEAVASYTDSSDDNLYQTVNSFYGGSNDDDSLTQRSQSYSSASRQHSVSFDRRKASWILAIILVLGGIGFAAYTLLKPFEVVATVDHYEWSRTIQVQEYRTERDGGWSIPAGGRQVSTESRVHHYNRVLDHYETKTRRVQSGTEQYQCGTIDNGNGTFSDRMCSRPTYRTETYQDPVYRQDPVYQTWYNYDIDRWGNSRQVRTSGGNRSDPEPHWGELTLNCNGQATLGCERESRREEHYVVVFTYVDGEEVKTHRMKEDRADWDTYDEREYVLVLNRLGQLLNDPLHPEEDR